MKKIYNPHTLLVLFCFLSFALKSQAPCSGTPGGNTVLPLSHTVCAGSSATMNLANSYNTSGITYQWQSSTVSAVGPFISISGATLNSYTSGALNTTIYYNVIITCTNSGLSISVPHMVSVIPCASPCNGSPASTNIAPLNTTLCAGASSSMSLSTSYTSSGITYQWGASSSPGSYSAIPGATLNSYSSGSLLSNTFYNVVITCTNSGLSYTATSAVSVISCTYCSGTPGSNTVLPVTHTLCAGNSASMSLANSYTASGITYQWQSSTVSAVGPFTSISGATLNTYNSGPLNTTSYYNVIITCTNSGQSISVPHTVSIINCSVPCSGMPASTFILPQTQTLCAGGVASLSLSTSYTTSGITYQWGSATTSSGPYTAIPGATLSTYTSGALTTNQFYTVSITCTNSGQSVVANHALTIINCTYCAGVPSANSVVPISHTVCNGAAASMSLINTYTASGITYQWQSSTVSAVGPFTPNSGANQNSYTSPPLNVTSYFSVIVSCTNSGQSITVPHTVTVINCGPVGLNAFNFLQGGYILYPNPNSGEFIIECPVNTATLLDLIDGMGKKVLTINGSGGKSIINISHLPNGLYYARLKNEEGIKVFKVMKE